MTYRPWDKTHPGNIFGKPTSYRLSDLEERVGLLEALLRQKFPNDLERLSGPQNGETQRRRRGPQPRISDEHLRNNRFWLIDLFENYWPELQPVFKKADATTVRNMLAKFTDVKYGHLVSIASGLLNNLDHLLNFLKSSDYNGDPRQAANAMAGVPSISWSTSLKRCRAMPADDEIKRRALRDYLKRNFYSVYIRIRNLENPEQIKAIMAENKTADREYRWMAERPEFVLEIMRLGLPKEL